MAANPILVFVLANIAFVALSVGIIFVLVSWRNNKIIHTSFNSLLDRINQSQPKRKEFYIEKLTGNFKLDASKADELSSTLVRQEISLYHCITKAQVMRSPDAISGLENDITQVIDGYLDHFTQYFNDHLESESNNAPLTTENNTTDDISEDSFELIHDDDLAQDNDNLEDGQQTPGKDKTPPNDIADSDSANQEVLKEKPSESNTEQPARQQQNAAQADLEIASEAS